MIRPCLMVITDTDAAPVPRMMQCIESVCAQARPGAVVVQLRDKHLHVCARLELAQRLRAITRGYGQHLIVSERCDLAVAVGADGVHLPERTLSVEGARTLLPPGSWVSVSSHDPDAPPPAADAVVLAPIVSARKGRPPLGEGGLRRMRQILDSARNDFQSDGPLLFALGGVKPSNIPQCLAAGAHGVAMIGSVYDSSDHRVLIGTLKALRESA